MKKEVLTEFFKVKHFNKKRLIVSSDIEQQYFEVDNPIFFDNVLNDKDNVFFDINNEIFIFRKADYDYFRSEENDITTNRFKFISTFPETDIMFSESSYGFFYQGLDTEEELDFIKFELKNKALKEAIGNNEEFFLGFPIKYKEIDCITYVINIEDILNR